MPVTSKLAEIIAAELQDELYYKDSPTFKGRWYRTGFRENTRRGYEVQVSETKARQLIADVLGAKYQTTSGFTQTDLNNCVVALSTKAKTE